MTEADIQREIRKAISPYGTYFRGNVGQAWTGTEIMQLPSGDILIKNPRPFDTGLPKGFPDLFGFTLRAGIPVFTGIEVKTPIGRVRPDQKHMLAFLQSKGAIAGIARSPKDAIHLLK
jgi:hypothetical protein